MANDFISKVFFSFFRAPGNSSELFLEVRSGKPCKRFLHLQ